MIGYNFEGIRRVIGMINYTGYQEQFIKADDRNLTVKESLSYRDNAFKNRVLYRGDTKELQETYRKLKQAGREDNFWGQTPSKPSQKIYRVHSGLPSLMVNTMTNVVLSDMRSITFGEGKEEEKVWVQIDKENGVKRLLSLSMIGTLHIGDGAFKITYDNFFTPYPIIEWYDGDEVDYVYNHGRVVEVIFSTNYTYNSRTYTLKETYGYGYIKNKLYDGETPVSMDMIPQTAKLRDRTFGGCKLDKHGNILENGSYMLAVPLILFPSTKYEGRGESIYDKRETLLTAIDEDLSQWMESIRAGRPNTFISEELANNNSLTGEIMEPSAFDNRFWVTGNNMGENAKNGITTVQFEIPYMSYFQTHTAFLDCALQGFMSASTLGIDVKKMDNAEAQREKEKTTLYTRAQIVEIFSDVVKTLVVNSVQAYYDFNGINKTVNAEPIINFGEYANPSYEANVETMAKAKQAGLCSIRNGLYEMYGDSKTEEWYDEEERRIKEEQGTAFLDMPNFGDNSDFNAMTRNGGEFEFDDLEEEEVEEERE